jgi:hypothetical protein
MDLDRQGHLQCTGMARTELQCKPGPAGANVKVNPEMLARIPTCRRASRPVAYHYQLPRGQIFQPACLSYVRALALKGNRPTRNAGANSSLYRNWQQPDRWRVPSQTLDSGAYRDWHRRARVKSSRLTRLRRTARLRHGPMAHRLDAWLKNYEAHAPIRDGSARVASI